MINAPNIENENHEHAPIDIDVTNAPNSTNKNVHHTPNEMITWKIHLIILMWNL